MGPEALIEVIPRQRSAEVAEQASCEAIFAFGHDDRFALTGDRQLGVIEGQVIEAQYFGCSAACLAVAA